VPGPVDQAPLDARHDIVRFTSDVLAEPVTIAGPVTMDLHATTDGRDTHQEGDTSEPERPGEATRQPTPQTRTPGPGGSPGLAAPW
jgi:hypothetical protein